MMWTLLYHPDVEDDLDSIGPSAARRIMREIDGKLTKEPLQFGAPLSGKLSRFRNCELGTTGSSSRSTNKW